MKGIKLAFKISLYKTYDHEEQVINLNFNHYAIIKRKKYIR